MCGAAGAMPDDSTIPIPHLKFGSPFDHDPAHPGGLVPEKAIDAPLPAVLWEGISEGEASTSTTRARQSKFERGLGVVTLLVRGRFGQACSLHLNSELSAPHPLPDTLSPEPYTIHPTPYTSQLTSFTLHATHPRP